MSKFPALALGLVVVGTSVLIWLLNAKGTLRGGTTSPDVAPTQEPTSPEQDVEQRETVTTHSHNSSQVETEKHTKRELLRDYWGDRWPTIEQQILTQGGDLDTLVEASEIAPWEVVEADLRKWVLSDRTSMLANSAGALQLEPAENVYDQLLRKNGLPLSEENRAALKAVTESYGAEMDRKLNELVLAEERYRQRVWDEGLYAAGPYFEVGGPDFLRQPGGGWSISYNVREWQIYFRLEPAGDPTYANALNEVKRVRSERQQGWQETLDALR